MFDLTHDVKLSFNMGELIPILALDCLPGDKFDISCESLLRFAPLVSPVMHRMDVTMHYFFVPNRLVWPNWEDFITGGAALSTPPTPPYIDSSVSNWTRLYDYMGCPDPNSQGDGVARRVSAIPFAAYTMIYNEYYRDQNLIDPVDFELSNGDNNVLGDLRVLRRRAWEHDYFTASLPFAQKGPAVDIPLGDVILNPDADISNVPFEVSPTNLTTRLSGDITAAAVTGFHETGAVPSITDPNGSLTTESTTINDLRTAFKLQEWFEKNARAGTRYIESILAHFGVNSPDARLQRPEYITGTKSPVVISEILNTTGTDDLPQGNMAGHGVSVTSGKYGHYSCKEHGYIIGIMSVLPRTAYQQGIPKHLSRLTDKFQYAWPEFAHLGEQEVLNQEVFAHTASDLLTFGYMPRYGEYRYLPSRVAGDFRDTLNNWHLGRIFDVLPTLSQEFIEADPTSRVFAVTDPDVQKMYAHVLNKIRAVRPLPKFGTPTF